MANNKQNSTSGVRTHVKSVIIAALVLSALALGMWLLRGFAPGGSGGEFAGGEPFAFETSSELAFGLCGDGLAIASGSGLQLTDGDGILAAKSVFAMNTPAVSCSENGFAAFFDVGGVNIRVADRNGDISALETNGNIITACVNRNGWLALCTEETGYKGMVTVYNTELEPVYRWHSGSGWLLKAAVSPDGRSLAALCLESGGAVLHIFRLDSEEEQASVTMPDELFFDLMWLSDSRLCLVGQQALIFAPSNGAETQRYDFAGQYLAGYDCSGGQVSVFLSKYYAGGMGTLIVLDSDGEPKARLETDRGLISLSRSGSRTLALFSDGMTLYSDELREIASDTDTLGCRTALLRSDGRVLLVSSYSGELRTLKT